MLSALLCFSFLRVLWFSPESNRSILPPSSEPRSIGDPDPLSRSGSRISRELNRGTAICRNVRRPQPENIRIRHERWQVEKSEGNEIVLYSAFYDDRPLVGVTPWIRVLGVASLRPPMVLDCYLWYDGHDSPYVTPAVNHVTGRQWGYKVLRDTFVQYLFSCRLPASDPVPVAVSVVVANTCSQSTTMVPIQKPIRAPPEHEIGVCVAISFGTVPVPEFVEWIEFHRLFGVAEFNVYNCNMVNMETVFEYYVDRGILRVFDMPPAVELFNRDGAKLNSPASLNDCLMRNVYRYGFIETIDFDEFIIPRDHDNYTQLLDHIDKMENLKERSHSYIFRNAYFWKEFDPDETQPVHLLTARYRRRSNPSALSIGAKSFVDPRYCLSLMNHRCYIPIQQKDGQRPVDVSISVALNHHYRKCEFAPETCRKLFLEETPDDTTLKFKDKLQERVESVLREIGHLIDNTD